MALTSPGIQISINDQSQYVNSNVGSTPLVILATTENKLYNGSVATGTTKANAGKLLSFSSQRDLVSQLGTPGFQLSSSGTPVNGSEINEYGLLTAYSALGLTNSLYAIRADVDLAQLQGTSSRPIGKPADGTYWLDTANTEWGITEFDAVNQVFVSKTPIVIDSANQVINDNSYPYPVPTPIPSIGTAGDYALVIRTADGSVDDVIRLFNKLDGNVAYSSNFNNTWQMVGSTNWQLGKPAVTGTRIASTNPSDAGYVATGSTVTINGFTTAPTGSVGLTALALAINTLQSQHNTGVYAGIYGNRLNLFVTQNSASDGLTVDGKCIIADGTNTPLAHLGVPAGDYYSPILFYGNYAQSPGGQSGGTTYGAGSGVSGSGWYASDDQPRPSGSVWWKTTGTGGGWNAVLRQYDINLDQFTSLTTPFFSTTTAAIYGLDPTGGGINIKHGQTVAVYSHSDNSANNLRFFEQQAATATVATGAPIVNSDLYIGDTISITATVPGTTTQNTAVITIPSSPTAQSMVAAILAANIPYVTVTLNADNSITFTHTTGGGIILHSQSKNLSAAKTPLAALGFVDGEGSGFVVHNYDAGSQYPVVYINNFKPILADLIVQANAPHASPANGTYWYYSDPTEVDILINTGSAWVGYQAGGTDVRGYALGSTDPNGVIMSTTKPTSNSMGNSLVNGDLWLDTSTTGLANYPMLSRYSVSKGWVSIDNTDHVSSNGIIFADARWSADGSVDIVDGTMPSIADLAMSTYTDPDAPDFQLSARGTLLFNTRRSGYNVKKYVQNYFNAESFPNMSLPTANNGDAWVTASGLDSMGVMSAGSMSQRAIVVEAMRSAIDSNLDILSPTYQFNLLCAPNYPEVIPNLLTLNDNRGDTAFVIGDTPMDLVPNTVAITNWINNTNGNGLPSDASVSPYLALYYPAGRTNDLAGNSVVVPASHAALRTFLYSDQVSYPWFAPAGLNRGRITNLNDIGYINSATGQFVHNSISQGMRDSLFNLSINPLTQLPGSGLVVFGQLTRSGTTTARNRVNVVRLENYLRTIFNSIANGYLFEPNDTITRKSIASQIESALNGVLASRGLYDFLVICDTSNNTPATISNNQLYVDVAIEPMRDVEFIYIPIAIYNPGSISQLNTTST